MRQMKDVVRISISKGELEGVFRIRLAKVSQSRGYPSCTQYSRLFSVNSLGQKKVLR